ncbi:MAG TPA: hemerythrin domain-containing protein [Coriobacteriia bacterium]
MTIEWDNTLETGDLLVDLQHERIHRTFHELLDAEDTPGEIMRVLDRLTVHVAAHFATEEDLMEREAFPPHLAELHRVEHARLTESTREIVLSFHRGELTSTAPIVDFLRDWLSTHVHQCDRILIEHVQSRGGAAELPEPWASSPPPETLAS